MRPGHGLVRGWERVRLAAETVHFDAKKSRRCPLRHGPRAIPLRLAWEIKKGEKEGRGRGRAP